MGVLDDAIREHLELKKAHGAPDDEITRQSQEALGPPRRERPRGEEADDDGDPGDAATVVETPPERSEAREADAGQGRPADDDDLFGDMPGREARPEPAAPASDPPDADGSTVADAAPLSDAPPPGPVIPEQGSNGAQGREDTAPPETRQDPDPPIPDPTAAPPAGDVDPDATMLYETVGETPPDADADAGAPGSAPPGEPATGPPTPAGAPPGEETEAADADPAGEQPRDESDSSAPGEDVLEDTPEFLQETPEDERLWFEQKPPRDFDFDD